MRTSRTNFEVGGHQGFVVLQVKDRTFNPVDYGPEKDLGCEQMLSLVETYAAGGWTGIILDLSPVDYADDTAWGIIIAIFKKCKRNHCPFMLCGLSPTVSGQYETMNLGKLIPAFASIEAVAI